MAGLAETLGKKTITVKLRDKDYVVSPPTLNDFAAVEQLVRNRRIEALQAANVSTEVIVEAVEHTITDDQVMEFIGTLTGIRFMFWRCLQRGQPDMTIEDVDALIGFDNMGDMEALIVSLGLEGGAATEENPPQGSP